jgi:hypothetical protein
LGTPGNRFWTKKVFLMEMSQKRLRVNQFRKMFRFTRVKARQKFALFCTMFLVIKTQTLAENSVQLSIGRK